MAHHRQRFCDVFIALYAALPRTGGRALRCYEEPTRPYSIAYDTTRVLLVALLATAYNDRVVALRHRHVHALGQAMASATTTVVRPSDAGRVLALQVHALLSPMSCYRGLRSREDALSRLVSLCSGLLEATRVYLHSEPAGPFTLAHVEAWLAAL